MTPEERNLVTELFDRLATLEDAQRDPEAERLVKDGLRQAPNAPYALVQTALVQDEALKRANARIEELEAAAASNATPPRDNSFLGGVRDAVLGRRGSVPSVRPGEAAPEPSSGMSSAWRTTGTPVQGGQGSGYGPEPGYGGGAPGYGGGAPGYGGGAPGYGGAPGGFGGGPGFGGAPMQQGGGGSFLGTAAAAAAGMVGGSLLMSGIRNLMGGSHGSAHAAFNPSGGGSSFGGGGAGSAAGGSLSRDAGLNDIGRSGADRQRLADQDQDDDQDADDADGDFDGGDDEE
jgi:hypothetical protein